MSLTVLNTSEVDMIAQWNLRDQEMGERNEGAGLSRLLGLLTLAIRN